MSSAGSTVRPSRVRWLRSGPAAGGARYVLYWIQMNQRSRSNAALDFAVEQADALGLPLVAYQGLRPDYPGANDRIHAFILEGARDLARGLAEKGILHLFHLERRPSAAAGLIAALARDAALVVTDHFPCFIAPAQSRALARQLERPLAAVEASCIVPSALFPKMEFAARTFRPKIHRLLPEHLTPREEIAPRRPSIRLEVPFPFEGRGLDAEEACWLDLEELDASRGAGRTGNEAPRGDNQEAAERGSGIGQGRGAEQAAGGIVITGVPIAPGLADLLASCAIDHRIEPSPVYTGGEAAARERLASFVGTKLADYDEARNDPARDGTSGLSPYLHFGQISALEIALAVLVPGGRGSAGPKALAAVLCEALAAPQSSTGAFLEQLVVRRELAFNFCERNPHHASIEGLPEWASRTLSDHDGDPREPAYDAETLEWAETEDEVWNAAQQELRAAGVIHNRMRMLWGKKILEWSPSPAEAVRVMIDLHDRYALDGRDPNTYANILWCLGLHDRPFGPQRPILGLVRPMSTAVTKKKLDLDGYRARIARSSATGRRCS